MTVVEAAEIRGIRNFDTAIPIGWVNEVADRIGRSPVGHFVWSYDPPGAFGVAAPITPEGDQMEKELIECGYHAMTYQEILETS